MIVIDLNLVPASFKANNKVYASIKDAYLYTRDIHLDVYFGKEEISPGVYICESFEEWLDLINQMKLEKLL